MESSDIFDEASRLLNGLVPTKPLLDTRIREIEAMTRALVRASVWARQAMPEKHYRSNQISCSKRLCKKPRKILIFLLRSMTTEYVCALSMAAAADVR